MYGENSVGVGYGSPLGLPFWAFVEKYFNALFKYFLVSFSVPDGGG
jgi:hypothetical protein